MAGDSDFRFHPFIHVAESGCMIVKPLHVEARWSMTVEFMLYLTAHELRLKQWLPLKLKTFRKTSLDGLDHVTHS